jgi:peptidoglycan-associated lipoprotein
MRAAQLFVVLASVLALTGCPKRNQTAPEGETGDQTTGAQTSGAQTSGAGQGTQLTPEQIAQQELQRAGMVIFFDYDRAEIRSEFVPIVAAHAKYLNANSGRSVRLEGHADERGSREYNIGLGERRAQAVRRALMLQGVTDTQITTVSYGEERPTTPGSDDEAYAKNRRVELVYTR